MKPVARAGDPRDRRPRRALVVFHDAPARPWQHLLRRGFRHCFLLLPLGGVWLFVDPRLVVTDLGLLTLPADFDVAAWYRRQGYTAVWAERGRARRRFPWRPYTCVEAVKRVLGLDAPWVLTPWQLYQILVEKTILDIRQR